jgi:DegP2 peptidase. Serine peptidase. MEROPS family S01B
MARCPADTAAPAFHGQFRSEPLPEAAPPPLEADERNNISVYERVSPGVVNINTTSFVEDFFFGAYPQQGSGSGSIIDTKGHILTNYHGHRGSQPAGCHPGRQHFLSGDGRRSGPGQ